MEKQFIPPIRINKKPTKAFTWSDGCPMSLESINPIYRIDRNHYADMYELYKKLYRIGYVCINQTAITQVHRYPAATVVFKNLNFHIFQPTFCWYTCDDINPKNVVDDHRKYWERTNRSLDAATHILKQFSKKFDRYGRKITMKDKLNQAIQNAKKAEEAAKQAERLVKQYKNHSKKRYIVLVAYDNLWACSDVSTRNNSCDFLVATEHEADNTFSLDYVSRNDLEERESFGLIYWLTKKHADYVAKMISKCSFNTNKPIIMDKCTFNRIWGL